MRTRIKLPILIFRWLKQRPVNHQRQKLSPVSAEKSKIFVTSLISNFCKWLIKHQKLTISVVRNKTDLVGSCVTQKKHRTCPLKLCSPCLVNMYGENPDEVALKTDWVCPKCRGECNCSCCRNKQGQQLTGNLAHRAKNSGCGSVSEFLKTEGSEKYIYQKKAKKESVVVASPPTHEGAVTVKLDQENAFERSKKTKREELNDTNSGCSNENAAVDKSSPKRTKISYSVHETGVTAEGENKKTAAEDIKGKNIAGKIGKITLFSKGKRRIWLRLNYVRATVMAFILEMYFSFWSFVQLLGRQLI